MTNQKGHPWNDDNLPAATEGVQHKPTAGEPAEFFPSHAIVTATKEQLFEIGMCSNHTIKWLTNGEPKRVKSVSYNAYGRRMFYLHGEDDNEISSWWGWVYEDMTVPVYKGNIVINGTMETPGLSVDRWRQINIGEPDNKGIIRNVATEEVTRKDFEGEDWKENATTAVKTSDSNA